MPQTNHVDAEAKSNPQQHYLPENIQNISKIISWWVTNSETHTSRRPNSSGTSILAISENKVSFNLVNLCVLTCRSNIYFYCVIVGKKTYLFLFILGSE